jgi:hypothetical protein
MNQNPEDRSVRIAELEARLSRRASVGVMPPVAALALCAAVGLLWMQYDEVSYFFSSREPLSLGLEGDYHLERALPNRYAEIHGTPTIRGAYGIDRSDQHFVVVGLQNSPVLVKRRALPSEDWRPGTTPPQPDQRPFAAQGRLIARGAASRWSDAFTKHDEYGEVKAHWLLLEGARPGGDFAAMAWIGVLFAFAGVNLWLLLRGVLALFARAQS